MSLVCHHNSKIEKNDIFIFREGHSKGVGKIIDITDTSIIALPFVDLKNLEFVQVINNQ